VLNLFPGIPYQMFLANGSQTKEVLHIRAWDFESTLSVLLNSCDYTVSCADLVN
jgi:hypothetical protein